jgi:hypothetical protein
MSEPFVAIVILVVRSLFSFRFANLNRSIGKFAQAASTKVGHTSEARLNHPLFRLRNTGSNTFQIFFATIS